MKKVYRIRRTNDDAYVAKNRYSEFTGALDRARLFGRKGDVTKFLRKHMYTLKNFTIIIEECEVSIAKVIPLEDW